MESKKSLSHTGSFVAGGIAACGAVTVTNPIELVKTRMQLQGELASKGQSTIVYRSLAQSLRTIQKNEGIKGVQSGLLAAYIYQLGLNGCRLGFYEPIRRTLNNALGYSHAESVLPIMVASGATSGIMGAILGSPFYLVKTRMQSFSPVFPIGAQTHYTSLRHGLSTIVKTEGLKGLYRGVDAAIIRTGMGSSVQLPIYNTAKSILSKYDIVSAGPQQHLLASAMSGMGVAVVMNPGDVLMTRMYNQKGGLYKGPLDCFIKTVRYEGPLALYKGFVAHLWRIAPHTILTLMFMEQTMHYMKLLEGVAI